MSEYTLNYSEPMARPLDEDKREAILAAAAELVATLGTAAPTAKIAKAAGFAEGTLFTYFPTKDELLNQLFLEIEAELAQTMLDAYPAKGSPRDRARHLWDRLVDWGAANPMRRKALLQLKISDRINKASRRKGETLFRQISAKLDESLADHIGSKQAPDYVHAILNALIETTIELIAREPRKREQFKRDGFEVFWKGIAG
jgi:AcrR family transcriptional regulator